MKFPKKIFVKVEDGGEGPEYLNCSQDIDMLVTTGEETKLAVYQLVETVEAKGLVQTKPSRRKR